MLCQCKKGVQFSLKAIEIVLLQSKTKQQWQRKPEAIFVKKAKIENADKHAAPAITTFAKNIRKLFAYNAITNRLKLIVSGSKHFQCSKRFVTVGIGLQY